MRESQGKELCADIFIRNRRKRRLRVEIFENICYNKEEQSIIFWRQKRRRNKIKMQAFESIFLDKAEYVFTAGGRINVIGEHVDYCGGKVFPASLNLRCNVYAKKREGKRIRMAFKGIDGVVEVDTTRLNDYRNLKIGNYQAGVAYFLQQQGVDIVGCDLYYDCSVPFGSGLSSSASIEVATAVALCELAGVEYDKVEIAKLSQKAENEYVGVNCGIMDQFASAMGKKDHAILLDCATLSYEYVPLVLGRYAIVVANCNKPHSLVESKYNERRMETDEALRLVRAVKPVSCLAELTPADFEAVKHVFPEIIAKRVKHVVYECDRVRLAVDALRAGEIEKLGSLLKASHESLRDLYEVTGKELDALSAVANAHPACVGARMIGGGFGGCTISLVEKSAVEEFIRFVDEGYEKAVGYKASFYETSIEDGVTVKKL